MKKTLSLVISLFLFISLSAQRDIILPGKVVEQNSKFNSGQINYLSNTQVKSPGANPQLSDGQGKFTLVFPDQPFGNITSIFTRKSGYVVVNEEEQIRQKMIMKKP